MNGSGAGLDSPPLCGAAADLIVGDDGLGKNRRHSEAESSEGSSQVLRLIPSHLLVISLNSCFYSQLDHTEIAHLLRNSAWQYNRQKLNMLAVLGEGNFGKVRMEFGEKG